MATMVSNSKTDRIAVDERVAVLRRAPVFSGFTARELRSLAPRFTEAVFAKGATLFHDGDPARDFLVVASGELEVWAAEPTPHVVNRLGPGEHLGEIALLLEGRRTATVTAARRSVVLRLDAAQFAGLTERSPKVLAYLARSLARELDERTRGRVAPRTTAVIGVSGAAGVPGTSLVADALRTLLARDLGDAALIRLGPAPAARDAAAVAEATDPERRRPPAIIVDGGTAAGRRADLLADTCDVVVHVLAAPDGEIPRRYAGARLHRVVNRFGATGPELPVNRCEPYVLPWDPALPCLSAEARVARVVDERWSPLAPPLRRLAHKIRGVTVGIALGGGAAFGVAHAGVLAALEERGLDVDLVAGTSMGSWLAVAYACGRDSREFEARVRDVATLRHTLGALDPTVGRPGLLAGNGLRRVIASITPAETFADLALPCQTVATDIDTGERVCIGEGPIADAVRASCSIPMILTPVRRDGRTLVDGGMIDMVPVDVVREMGADTCIAVNVIPTLKRGAAPIVSRVSHRLNAFNPLSHLNGTRDMPSLVDVVMNALQISQYAVGDFQAAAADLRITVDASDFTWTDFTRADALIARGRAAVDAADDAIDALVASRPAYAW